MAGEYDRFSPFSYLGFVVVALVAGKQLRRWLWVRLRLPSCALAGCIAAVWFRATEAVISAAGAAEWRSVLDSVQICLQSVVCAALILGFARRGRSAGARMTARALWHEGIGQLLYGQLLVWGQMVVTLGAALLWRALGGRASPYLGAIVSLGFEAGAEVQLSAAVTGEAGEGNVKALLGAADGVGLVVGATVALALVNARHSRAVRRWLGPDYDRVRDAGGVEEPEAFSRAVRSAAAAADHDDDALLASPMPLRRTASINDDPTLARADHVVLAAPEKQQQQQRRQQQLVAGVGGHVGVVALACYLGYLVGLALELLEDRSAFMADHNLLTSAQLYPLSMLFALVVLRVAHARGVAFHLPWFHRLAGAFTDVLAVASCAVVQLPAVDEADRAAFAVVVLAALAWQAFAFVWVAPRVCPNFFFERALAEVAGTLGHVWLAIIVMRESDPTLQTPVTLSYCSRLLLQVVVPASGFRNSLQLTLVSEVGLPGTLALDAGVFLLWTALFKLYYERRWVGRASLRAARGNRARRRRASSAAPPETLADPPSPELSAALLGEVPLPAPRLAGGSSSILHDDHLLALQQRLPGVHAARGEWVLQYNLVEHGASLAQLLQRSAAGAAHLLVVEDTWGVVCGAFLKGPLARPTGESFVFSFAPDLEAHRWARLDDFVHVSADMLGIGGGGGSGGFALTLDEDLDRGTSQPCAVFNSPRLASSERFRCRSVEVWGV